MLARHVALLLLAATTACGQVSAADPAPPSEPAAAPVTATAAPRAPALPRGCSQRATACVSTAAHVAWLQEGGRVTYGPVPVSLGTRRDPTPRGTFHVAWKDAVHTSSTYGIPMPHAVFFAAGGVAFHEGPLDERSHGCVHLSRTAAAAFFAGLGRGDRVEVF